MNFQAKISVRFHYQIPKYAWNSFLKRMFDPLCSEEEITTYLNIHVQRQIWLLVIFVSRTPYFIFSHLHTSIFSSDVKNSCPVSNTLFQKSFLCQKLPKNYRFFITLKILIFDIFRQLAFLVNFCKSLLHCANLTYFVPK